MNLQSWELSSYFKRILKVHGLHIFLAIVANIVGLIRLSWL